MISVFMLAGVLLLTVPGSAARDAPAPIAGPAVVRDVDVSLDQTRISAGVGERLTVESRVTNTASTPTAGLVAHLNVASLDGGYVDLEDWSADVTRPLAPLAPGASTVVSWQFQAVNVGTFDIYIVVMPRGTGTTAPLVASPPVLVTVAGRQTLNAGGSLPILVVIPVLLGLAALAVRYRVRRTG